MSDDDDDDALRELVLAAVEDLALDLVAYDRREDEDLPAEALRDALVRGVVTTTELGVRFGRRVAELTSDAVTRSHGGRES